MLNLGAFGTHLQGRTTSATQLWAILKKNGVWVRGTAHDRKLTIATGTWAGTYRPGALMISDVRSTSDGAVQNAEVQGFVQVSSPQITVADIEAGLYDQAYGALLELNWKAPDAGLKIIADGTLGEFTRDTNNALKSEVRGLKQALAQQILDSFSERCNVIRFGDARCGFNVPAATRTATVATVTDRKHFTATLTGGPTELTPTYYDGGILKFTSGANDTYEREVKTAMIVGTAVTIVLWEETPADIAVANTFTLPPACDRRYETCRDLHNRLPSFRGHGIFATGRDALLAGPTSA